MPGAVAGNATITTGIGPPAAVVPDASIYIDQATVGTGRTNGYIRTGSKWFPMGPELGTGVVCDGIVILPPCIVAQLPAPIAVMAGWRGLAIDATQAVSSVSFGLPVTGLGANKIPVWCDGTAWRIG